MSTFRNLVLVALAAIFALGLVVTASATDVGGESKGSLSQLRQAYKDAIRQVYGPPLNPNQLPNGSGVRFAPHAVSPSHGVNSTSAPCAFQTNQCPGFENAFIFATPNRNGAGNGTGSRKAIGTQIINTGLLPESVKTVEVFILWDPANEEGLTFPTPGTPTLRAELYADGAGVPSGAPLASVSRVYADWTTDPDLAIDGGTTQALIGYVSFDFSASGIILGPGDVMHAGIWIDQFTPNVDYIWFWGDDGTTSTCPSKSSTYRSTVPGWVQTTSGSDQGLPFNYDIVIETCTEQPPPVCFNQMPHCDPNVATNVTIFTMPRTTRNAFANRFYAGQAGQDQACTVKVIYPWIYDDNPADSADIVFEIREDNGGGLPGAVVYSDSIPYAGLVKDLSAPTVINVPDVVVNGEFYVSYRAVNRLGAPSSNGYAITFVGSLSTGDAACLPYISDAMWVLLPDNVTWVTDVTFFGFESELWVSADLCCPALAFAACTPASDPDWETQGNGINRPNATNASLSSLCGLTQSWTASPGGACNMVQPLIAGSNVLIAGVDSLHCYDKATGAQNWATGGFPYIIGDLRGSPSVDDSLVYFGGAGAQAFTCVRLSNGSVKWSRNLGGVDTPLGPGITAHTSNVVSGAHVYFTQETGRVYKLDKLTGADAAGSPLLLPDAPGAVPYNSLSSDGTKLWVGTANTLGTAGNIHQIAASTMTIDWTLNSPGQIFYPGNTDFYDPEGFPGSLAYESGVLYYHSQIRNDGNGFLHFPQTGSVGAIDVALENGSGAGILWVNDADIVTAASPGTNLSTSNWSGPALGPDMVYLGGRGLFGGLAEQDGISAWDKGLGARVWYNGYTNIGVSGGVPVLDDIRSDVPVTVFCQGGIPYLFTSHMLGLWRLVDGNTGDLVWTRQFSERVRGTAVGDDCVAVATRVLGVNGPTQGQLAVFSVGPDRPRLQIDSQFVFRTATPGDGVTNDNIIDAIQNTGCINLNVASYNEINPPAVRVLGSNPMLAASAERTERKMAGYEALLTAQNLTKMRSIAVTAGLDEETDEVENVRTFASNGVKSASDPLFLTVNTAPGAIAPGATQTLNVDYDETGLTNNTGYTNFIEIDSDDPDYFPQDPSGASFGLPFIQFELFIGCPDALDFLTTGLGEAWLTNFGAEAGGSNFATADNQDAFVVNGNDAHHFDGGWALVVGDSAHWALDGVSVGAYPRRAGEWGPTLPCGLTVVANNYPSAAGLDAVEEVSYNMLDLASTNGYFTPSARQCGGVLLEVQRVGSQDADYGDFVLTHIKLTNEVGAPGDIPGAMNNVYFGVITDWDISSNDNVRNYNDGYAQEDNGAGAPGTGSWMDGHVRLDQNHVGAGGVGSGAAPTFMTADFFDQPAHGEASYRMMSNPTGYCATVDPSSCANTDLAALWSAAHFPSIADGASVDIYMAIYRVEDGVNGLPFVSGAAGAEAVYREVTCRAKAFAGFGKGDINCDGCIDLQDVVALGNIVDGLLTPSPAAVYTADADGDNDWDSADYNLLYDVVSGVQPASNLANGWRF
jgi:hypothetical protein